MTMKRATILTATLALLFLTCTGAKASAQNDTTAAQTAAVTGAPKAWFSFLTEIRMGSDILDYPKFMTYDWNIAPGVSFRNGLSLRIPVEAVFGMTKESYNDYDGYYSSNGTLGLNLGYDFLNKNDRMRLELNASGGSTYLKTPYRFAYADLSLKFGTKHLGAYNLYVGLGLRYLSPYNPDMTQKLLFNFTVGFWAGLLQETEDRDAFSFAFCEGAGADVPAVEVECGHAVGEPGDPDRVETAGDGLDKVRAAPAPGPLDGAEPAAFRVAGRICAFLPARDQRSDHVPVRVYLEKSLLRHYRPALG